MSFIRRRGGLVALLAVLSIVSAGCSNTPSASDAPTDGPKGTVRSTGEGGAPIKKEAGGAVPDMNPVPAPSGVKTGIEGGRK